MGILSNHKCFCEYLLKTLFGSMKIKRLGISKRNIGSLFPSARQLNLPKESYSFKKAKIAGTGGH